MIGLSMTLHDGNPRVGNLRGGTMQEAGERGGNVGGTWGKHGGNMSRIRQGGGRRKRKGTRDRHGKTGCINREAEIRR